MLHAAPAQVAKRRRSKEYEAELHRRKGAEADQPKLIKYKKLVRG
jgi:hypothetical protein